MFLRKEEIFFTGQFEEEPTRVHCIVLISSTFGFNSYRLQAVGTRNWHRFKAKVNTYQMLASILAG